jgi:hypothetical protein
MSWSLGRNNLQDKGGLWVQNWEANCQKCVPPSLPKGHGHVKYHRIPWPRIVH